jgi:hypothetical protein
MKEKNTQNSTEKQVRHPTEKKSVGSTSSVPFISIGIREKQLLVFLAKNESSGRFNLKDMQEIRKFLVLPSMIH